MKKIYMFILAALPFVAHSQITITQADLPVAGFGLVNASDSNYVAPIPAGGPAQSWNYASLLNVTQDSLLFISATGTPYASSFPNSNLATFDITTGTYVYFISNSTGLQINGAYSAQYGQAIAFNPTQMFIPVPFTYNSVYTGHSRVQIDTTLQGISTRLVLYTAITITGDGYGSLTLPTQTYPNTLRVRTTSVQTDSVFIQLLGTWIPAPGVTPTTTQTNNYQWLGNGNGTVLLTIGADSIGTTSQNSSYIILNVQLGVHEIRPVVSTSVYPNPSTNFVKVKSEKAFDKNSTLQIFDATGRIIESYDMSLLNEMTFSTSLLTQGSYSYLIKTNDSIVGKGRFAVIR